MKRNGDIELIESENGKCIMGCEVKNNKSKRKLEKSSGVRYNRIPDPAHVLSKRGVMKDRSSLEEMPYKNLISYLDHHLRDAI